MKIKRAKKSQLSTTEPNKGQKQKNPPPQKKKTKTN